LTDPQSHTDPGEFRRALGSQPTGVTVVTAIGPNGLSGATANAVCSLSLDPPLMLACLDLGSRTLRSVQAAGRFAINVLAAGQDDLARGFARKIPEPDKWEGVACSKREGAPALEGALLWIACELRDSIAGGDHVIVTGDVVAIEQRRGKPLVFYAGAYRPLS
jgi:flavin reductase (DIM6/NTAB) family NADH-FMN oxidoreductase RutF